MGNYDNNYTEQNNHTEISGYSFNNIYCKNGPQMTNRCPKEVSRSYVMSSRRESHGTWKEFLVKGSRKGFQEKVSWDLERVGGKDSWKANSQKRYSIISISQWHFAVALDWNMTARRIIKARCWNQQAMACWNHRKIIGNHWQSMVSLVFVAFVG